MTKNKHRRKAIRRRRSTPVKSRGIDDLLGNAEFHPLCVHLIEEMFPGRSTGTLTDVEIDAVFTEWFARGLDQYGPAIG
jgi:hypothetical protein